MDSDISLNTESKFVHDCKIENVAESVCITKIKHEPSDGEWPETCDNVYDSQFHVVEHEISDKLKVEYNDVLPTVTVKEEHTSLEHGVEIKLEPSEVGTSLPIENSQLVQKLNPCELSIRGTLKTKKATTGEKLACLYCDYKCLRKGHLDSHMMTHTGEKPYSCEYCEYKSSHVGTLNTHLKTHTGAKPYSCKRCDFKSSQACDLRSHFKIHIGEKVYSCEHCDYKCSLKNALKRHSQTHTGEKPYACTLCNYRSAWAGSVTAHMKTHLREKQFSCQHCSKKFLYSKELGAHLESHYNDSFFKFSKKTTPKTYTRNKNYLKETLLL